MTTIENEEYVNPVRTYKVNLYNSQHNNYQNVEADSDRTLAGMYEKMMRRYSPNMEVKFVQDTETGEMYGPAQYEKDQEEREAEKLEKRLFREEKEQEDLKRQAEMPPEATPEPPVPDDPTPYLKYVDYIINTKQVPLPTDAFDDDWLPVGPMVRPVLVVLGWITVREDGIRLTDDARAAIMAVGE